MQTLHRKELTSLNTGLISALSFILTSCAMGDIDPTENVSPSDNTNLLRAPLNSAADASFSDFKLTCRLIAEPETGNGVIKMILNNSGEFQVNLLKGHTVWKQDAPVFAISMNGKALRYSGIWRTNKTLRQDEILTILPGEEHSQTYSISEFYNISHNGTAQLRLLSPVLDAVINGQPLALAHDCGVAETQLATREPELAKAYNPLIYEDSSCTTERRAIADSAQAVARLSGTIARKIAAFDNPLYTRWFGTWGTARSGTVTSILEEIDGGWESFKGHCSTADLCSTASAWVNAWPLIGDRNLINLCNTYFDLKAFSVWDSSSRAGVIMHEKVHLASSWGEVFSGGWDDKSHSVCTDGNDTRCYGASDAMALAAADPGIAIENAENYEHFVSDALLVGAIFPTL